ncbi:MAG: FAD-dependent monooxygenase [Pseudonocardiales bacterium]|nr:FAD-dependent monooxygenase [Pseudonocardiales bacterium]
MVETQVIVVGAGPVGLMLAGELRLGGVDVVVVERLSAPTGESRASQLNARTMEVFDQRGLLERLSETQSESLGHFGGLSLDVSQVPSAYAGFWKIPQFRTEAMLQAWAGELGADIRRGHELRGLHITNDWVEAEVDHLGGSFRLRAPYLVGCDGEHSTVRQLAGFDFPGTDVTRELFRADVAGIDIPNRRFQRWERGLAIAAKRGGGVTRIMMHEFGHSARHRTEAPAFEEVVAAWRRITGEDISGGTPIWLDAFGDASRHVTSYRKGRVLLAGDAAHLQMPIGGQALNLGLHDAANLGWKLAAQVQGWAPAGLLDSYHDERHPVGARTLTNVQAQALLLLGGPEIEPLRASFGELLELDDVRRHLAAMASGLDVRYATGPGDHPWLGARMPHCELAIASGPSSTTVLLRPARGVLLAFSTKATLHAELSATATKWENRVHMVIAGSRPDAIPSEINALLLRPDGHIAWIDNGTTDLHAELSRWFGSPTPV